MTPDEAQRAINDADDLRSNIPAYCWRALEFVAGMREEWVGEYLDRNGKWDTICTYPTRKEVAHHLDYLSWDAYTNTRIVRRCVTEPEAADATD